MARHGRSPRKPSHRGPREVAPIQEVEPLREVAPLHEVAPIPEVPPVGGPGPGGGGGRRAGPPPAPRGRGSLGLTTKIWLLTAVPFALVGVVCGVLILQQLGGGAEAIDPAGVAAVRALAITEPDLWDPDLVPSFRGQREELTKAKEKELLEELPDSDSRNPEIRKARLAEYRAQFDKLLPQIPDEQLRADGARKRLHALARSMQSELEGFRNMLLSVRTSTGSTPLGLPIALPDETIRQIGQTRVVQVSPMERGYVHPVVDYTGAPRGEATLVVSTAAIAASQSGVRMMAIVTIVATVLTGALVAFMLASSVTVPLKVVVRDIDAVARGDLGHRVLSMRYPGEIGEIGRHLERMASSLSVQKSAETEHGVAVAEHSIGEAIRRALLPARPVRVDGFEIEALHKSGPGLHCDYHDFIEIGDRHVGLIVADSSAKDVPGAMITAEVRALVRALAPYTASPAKLLHDVNEVFSRDLPEGAFVSALYVILDRSTGVATIANAGHLPLLYWKLEKRGLAKIGPDGPALGLRTGRAFEEAVQDKRLQLTAGDRIVLYTDGAPNAVNAYGEPFGEPRFLDLVKTHSPKNSAAFVNMVANEIDLFHEGGVQHDDITLLTVRKVR